MDTQTVVGAIIIALCLVVINIPSVRNACQKFLDSTLGVIFNKR
jgi:hypothetical protein